MGSQLLQLDQADQAGIRRFEPARIEVERSQVILEVDVQPLATCLLRSSRGSSDERLSEARATGVG